jgi:hypothetical protein
MTKFIETDAGQAFIASAASRETSPEIMEAIAFFARDTAEAEELWSGDGLGRIAQPLDIWEHVTCNGLREADEFRWGTAGSQWWAAIAPHA